MWLSHLNSTPPSLPNDEIAMVLTPAYRGFGRDRMPETVQINLALWGNDGLLGNQARAVHLLGQSEFKQPTRGPRQYTQPSCRRDRG